MLEINISPQPPGEQLVWQQEDPVQEEHREGAGGGQHVCCKGRTGRCRQSWRISRSEYFLCDKYLFVLKTFSTSSTCMLLSSNSAIFQVL